MAGTKGATTRRPKAEGAAAPKTGRGTGAGKAGAATQRPQLGMKLKQDTPVRTYGAGNAFWYLKHEGELAMVTNEPFNEDLGITNIEIFPVTDAQAAYGQLCRIRLTTAAVVVENLTVNASERVAGDIYLRESGGRKVPGKPAEGNKPATEDKWYHDLKLSQAAKAQILSYIHQFVEV